MKKYIITKKQLNEYIKYKKDEKIFSEIVERLHENSKLLTENISHKKANQSIIDDYRRKNLITPKVFKMLVSYKIINENHEFLE